MSTAIQIALIIACCFTSLLVVTQVKAQENSHSPVGTWVDTAKESKVELYLCADKLCGKVVWLKEPNDKNGKPLTDLLNQSTALKQRPILGMKFLLNVDQKNERKWGGGEIYDAESGSSYKAKIELQSPNVLKISGCLGFFCDGAEWHRSKQ